MEYERKYLERYFNIYTSRYFHTAITYKLQNVFQYSVSLQYNYFDAVFNTMYFNTAKLCLWPMTFFGLAGRICPLLVHATSGLPFIPSFTCPLPLGMYRIVILPDNRIPDILLIETKPDSRIPDILQFFEAGFGYPAGYPANCLTGYPAR